MSLQFKTEKQWQEWISKNPQVHKILESKGGTTLVNKEYRRVPRERVQKQYKELNIEYLVLGLVVGGLVILWIVV